MFINTYFDTLRFSEIDLQPLEHNDIPKIVQNNTFYHQHLSFRLLVFWENKSHTEEAITTWRYVLMNLLSVVKSGDGPWSAFAKHNTKHRSRLQIWIQHRQMKNMQNNVT